MQAKFLLSSLRGRVLAFLVLAALPSLVVIAYTALHEYRDRVATQAEGVRRLTRVLAEKYSIALAAPRQILVSVAELPSVRERGRETRCREILALALRPHPHYLNIAVSATDGGVVCTAKGEHAPATTFGDRRYFRAAVQGSAFTFSEVLTGRILQKPAVIAAHPIIDAHKQVSAVLTMSIDLPWFQAQLPDLDMPTGSVIMVADGAGTILARRPQGDWVGKSVPDAPLLKYLRASPAQGEVRMAGFDGTERTYRFERLHAPGSDFYVAVGHRELPFVWHLVSLFGSALGVQLVVTAALLALAWWLAGGLFLRPIAALSRAAQGLEAGRRGARTGLADTPDEFGQLARTFDRMAASVETREHELLASNRELERVNRAYAALSASNRALLSATEEHSLLETVCRIPVDIADFRAAWIGYAENGAGRSVQVMAIAGHYDESMKALPVNWSEDDAWGAGPAGEALRSGQAQVARDVASEARLSHFHARAKALGYASALAAPFSHHDVRGVLVIYSEDRDAFGPKEVALFQETADDLAFAIHTVRARHAQKAMAEQLHRAAHYDSLTGLCSLLRLEQLLAALIAEAERSIRPFAVLVIEVDRFGEMVGMLGHRAGDALLKQVARRLARHFAGSAEVARVGGERFAVLLPNADGHRASAAALEVADLMNEDFHVDGLPVFASATAGVALYPAHGDSAPALLRCAADAIQGARQSHAPFSLYRAGSEQRSTQRLTLAADLRAALDRDELSLHCQPKVDVATRRPCGAEALARWHHPARGPVSPAQFIPVAEHTGLIRPLTYWAIAAVARQVHSLRRAGIGWPLAVNLSARNLHDPQLAEHLTASLATWNLQASDLELEITESALMEEPELARQTLLHLREAGYSLYVDDYGTGYSSLAYLKRLPLDAIKIDRSLLKGIDGDRDALLIVRSTIHMAHDLGLKVVAEGVEDETTLARLAELGCDTAQGYLFARPMPLEELLAWAKTAA